LKYARTSGNTLQELKDSINNSLPNQLNIVQPLKFSYISNFTPESCIKYGGVPGTDVNYFNDSLVGQNLPILYSYDMMAGVQQDSEHEGSE